MRKVVVLTVLAAIILLAGCATVQSQQKGIITACNGYAHALATAAAFRAQGKLSASQIDTINQVRTVVNPICTAPKLPTTAQALVTVENSVTQLTNLNAGVKK